MYRLLPLITLVPLLMTACAAPIASSPSAARGQIERAVRSSYRQAGIGDDFGEHTRELCAKADAGDTEAMIAAAEDVMEETLNGPLAVQILQQAMERGDPGAAKRLGELHLAGVYGVPGDITAAALYYEGGAYLPVTPETSEEILECAETAAQLYALEFEPPAWERFVAIATRITQLAPNHADAGWYLHILQPSAHPAPSTYRLNWLNSGDAEDILADLARDYMHTRDMLQYTIDAERDSIEFLGEERARRQAHSDRMGQIFLGGMQHIGQSFVQGQAQLDAARQQRSAAEAAGRAPILQHRAAASAGPSGGGSGPLVQTLPPSAAPPQYRDDGSMRSKYLHQADLYDWAASEYEKQGKQSAATNARAQADQARREAETLRSNAPTVAPAR